MRVSYSGYDVHYDSVLNTCLQAKQLRSRPGPQPDPSLIDF